MFDNMTRYLTAIASEKERWNLRKILLPLVDRYSTQPLVSAGLVISSTTTLAKIGAVDFYASVKGILVKIAAGTDMPALTGLNITAGSYNVICFFVDSAGAVTVAMGTEGTTLAKVVFPPFTENKALIGFLSIYYASTFTGGSTALNTATTAYISPVGPFDPSVLI